MNIHEQHNVLPKGGKSVPSTTTPYIARWSNPLGRCEWCLVDILIMTFIRCQAVLEYGAKPDKQSFSCHSHLSEDKYHT